ncbi:hypothetical protein FBU59_006207, partial [Linderina macrospora]
MQERPRPLSQPPVVIVRRMSVISEAYDHEIDETDDEEEAMAVSQPPQSDSLSQSAKASPQEAWRTASKPASPARISPRDSSTSLGACSSSLAVPAAEEDVRSMANSSGSFPFDPQAVYGPSLEDSSTMASRSSSGRPEIGLISRTVSASASLVVLQPMDSGDLPNPSVIRSRQSPALLDSSAQLLEDAERRANQPQESSTVPDHSFIGQGVPMAVAAEEEEGRAQSGVVGNESATTEPVVLIFPKESPPPQQVIELGHGFASVESLPEGTHPLQFVPNEVRFRVPLSDEARETLSEINGPEQVAQWEQQQLVAMRQQYSRPTQGREEEMARVSQFKRGASSSMESENGGLVYNHEMALTDAPTQGITSRGTIRQLHKRARNSEAYYPIFDLLPAGRNRVSTGAEVVEEQLQEQQQQT